MACVLDRSTVGHLWLCAVLCEGRVSKDMYSFCSRWGLFMDRARSLVGTSELFDGLDEVSHRALHLVPGIGFRNPTVVFASKAVANQIVVRAVLDDLRDCQKFVFHNDAPAAAGLRGSGFEYLVHADVSIPERDHTFEARALGNSPPLSTVTLRCTKARFLENIADLTQMAPGEYGIGRSSFPAVDGVFLQMDKSVDFVQVTVSADHGVKHQALREIVEALTDRGYERFRLLWIVPSAMFEGFPTQSFRLKGSKKVHREPCAALRHMPQYVAAFPEDETRFVATAETLLRDSLTD